MEQLQVSVYYDRKETQSKRSNFKKMKTLHAHTHRRWGSTACQRSLQAQRRPVSGFWFSCTLSHRGCPRAAPHDAAVEAEQISSTRLLSWTHTPSPVSKDTPGRHICQACAKPLQSGSTHQGLPGWFGLLSTAKGPDTWPAKQTKLILSPSCCKTGSSASKAQKAALFYVLFIPMRRTNRIQAPVGIWCPN